MKTTALLMGMALLAGAASCHSAYQTIPYAQSAALKTKLPFVKEYAKGPKTVFVYGSYHTNDSTDAEGKDIERNLAAFRPDIILYEGDYIGVEASRNASLSTYFEMGLARWWRPDTP